MNRPEYTYARYKEEAPMLNCLKIFCDQMLKAPSRQPDEARYHGRVYKSPFHEEAENSTGTFRLVDSAYGKNWNNGKYVPDRWIDRRMRGDIFYLAIKLGKAQNRREAKAYIAKWMKDNNITPPELTEEELQARYAHREGNRYDYYVKNRKVDVKKIEEDGRAAWAQRRQIAQDVLDHFQENCLVMNPRDGELPPMPVILTHSPKTHEPKTVAMTGLNYIQAIGRYARIHKDPRYITEHEAKLRGYRIRQDAVPCNFEWSDARKDPVHLRVWQLYNAEDVIGMPPYKDVRKTPEEVNHAITDLLKAQGIETYEDPAKNRESLHQLCKDMTWNQALVPGARAMEAELMMTKILHQLGDRTPYQVLGKDQEAIERHLRRDLNERGLSVRADDIRRSWYQVSKNLAQSCIGMDRAVRAVMDNYEQAKKKTHEMPKTTAKELFHGLSITAKSDIKDNAGKIRVPKGITLTGKDAYETLAQVITDDRREFAHERDRGYGRRVDLDITYQDKSYDVRVEHGRLLYGNVRSVTEYLQNVMTHEAYMEAYHDSARRRAVSEKINQEIYKDPDLRKLYKKYREGKLMKNDSPKQRKAWLQTEKQLKREVDKIGQAAQKQLEDRYRDAVKEAKERTTGFDEAERKYWASQPGVERSVHMWIADTYRYIIPDKNENGLITQRDILRAYGAENVISVTAASRFTGQSAGQEKLTEGTIIELRYPLHPTEMGCVDPTRQATADLPAEPYLLNVEKSRMAAFEEFSVTIDREITDKETGKWKTEHVTAQGEEARQLLGSLMIEDRDQYVQQQETGLRDIDVAMRPIHVQASYRDSLLIDESIYLGDLSIGNHYTPSQMITARQPGNDPLRQTALELGRAMHSVRKYAPDDRLDRELDLWNALEPEELMLRNQKDLRPKGAAALAPRVGQTAENEMTYYEMQAQVNGHRTPDAISKYMIYKLAPKMTPERMLLRFEKYKPALADTVRNQLQKPEIQAEIANRSNRRYIRRGRKSEAALSR